MTVSALGQFVAWLHSRAQPQDAACEEAEQVLEALLGEPIARTKALTEAQIAGLELRSGRPRNELAKKIQRAAFHRLRSLDLALLAVDELGYLPILVRVLLQHHFWELERAPLGSDAHLTYTDLSRAIERSGEKTRTVSVLLALGYGPQEIGAALKTNGSRRIGKAMNELSRILEGRVKNNVTR